MPTGSGEGSPECPLASEFPTVPAATRQRFLTARDGDVALASSMLREHLAWRAANFPLRDGAPRIGAGLPEFVWVHPGRARDGTRILTEMCCMIDKKCASNDEYELAVAQFLFDLFDDDLDSNAPDFVQAMRLLRLLRLFTLARCVNRIPTRAPCPDGALKSARG